MAEHSIPAARPLADVVMRRMLHLMAQLNSTCADDAAELDRLRQQRQADITAAERAARNRAEQAIAAAHELSSAKSLGSRLRAQLNAVIEVHHADAGPPPDSLDDAVAEWSRIAPSAERRVREFRAAYDVWQQRLIKRAKSAPQIDESLWRDLDRLDLIHRAIPALRQAVIAGEIQASSAAADVVLEAEAERRTAGQTHLAEELKAAIATVEADLALPGARWADPRWGEPSPAEAVERLVRVGELVGDLPAALGVDGIPALITFPFAAGIAVEASLDRRGEAVGLMKSLMLRLFAAVPPGSLHMKAIDPVALGQSVAEFRHLAEYDDQLVDDKTWTSERDIERLLDNLTNHIEVVISQYLKGQFETIDEYNEHAGEVSEPYRLLVVFDYPTGFSERAARQLLSLVENGPRCGVYTLLHHTDAATDGTREVEPSVERITRDMHRVGLHTDEGSMDLPAPVGRIALRLLPDQAPPIVFDENGRTETIGARLLATVGQATKAALERPAAVTLGTLLPVLRRSRTGILPDFDGENVSFSTDPETWWHATTTNTAVAPLGRSGAQQATSLHFSSTDIAGGAIMVGLPRSGKTTSLHAVIMTMAMLYSPDELELYLIDAKHGVEFKVYEHLPHARMVSVHSDREFSLAILKVLDNEIRRRAELMKAEAAGRANITEYRTATGKQLSRIVIVIDEFHEIFEEPDRIGQEAFAAFSNIVRMGPFSGVHVVVASQTLSSMPAMDRPTLMLLPQRVAFTCTEYDAEALMGSTNQAPLRLSKTGEGVFNPARGDEPRNQLFQGLHISADERDDLLAKLSVKAQQNGWTRLPRVFDGDAVVPRLTGRSPDSAGGRDRLTIGLGEPFSLDDAETVVLRRSRGSHVLLVGNEVDAYDRALTGALHSCLLTAHRQAIPATVVDFAGDEGDDDLTLLEVAEALGAHYVRSGGAVEQLTNAAATVAERTAASEYKAPTQLLVVVGLERAGTLKPPDPYAHDDQEPAASTALLAVLQGGPEVGVHAVIRADRAKTVEQKLGPDALPELAFRIASSVADQADLAFVADSYGGAMALRTGQLLLADRNRGTVKRVRGYSALRTPDLVGIEQEVQGEH